MDPTADFEVDARSGVHETTEETDTVVFVGPGQELSFTRVIGTEFPVIIGYNEAQAVGGVESMVLLEDDSVLLQLSAEAAEELDLDPKVRFWIDSDAAALVDEIIAMLEATGEFDPSQYE